MEILSYFFCSLKYYLSIVILFLLQFFSIPVVASSISHGPLEPNITVVVDVFRAFTTACYVFDQKPLAYIIATESSVIETLKQTIENPFLIGKPEKGSTFLYDIPNSPTRVLEHKLFSRFVLHRTAAGAKGILHAQKADIILAAGFVNAWATAKYIRSFKNPHVLIMPMGHEGITPSLEDTLCAQYIDALIKGKRISIDQYLKDLRQGPGSYFFSEDQQQYPSEDFYRSLEIDRFHFAIVAEVIGDYAILSRRDQ